MTIKEAYNFYDDDSKKYILQKNQNFLDWYNGLIKNGYTSFMNISELQDFINKITIWYEMKYPDLELQKEKYGVHPNYQNLKDLSKELTMEQLMFRLSHKENCLLSCFYRSGGGTFRYNSDIKKYVPEIYVSFRSYDNINEKLLYYKNDYSFYLDGYNGKITSIYDLPIDLIIEDDMTIEQLFLLLSKSNKYNLSKVRKCIKLHESDILIRNMMLQFVALKLLYSKNTTPEYGYERAKLCISEFNDYFNFNLSLDEIEYLFNKDYNIDSKKTLDDNKLNELVSEQKRMIKRMKK